jgi:hypothetical protein
MRDERMLLLEQLRAAHDQQLLVDALLQDVDQRLQAMPAGTTSAAYLALLREQQLLAQHLTATLQEQQDLVCRYLELLRRVGHMGTTDAADRDTA